MQKSLLEQAKESENYRGKEEKMINQIQLGIIGQIIDSLEEAIKKLEEAQEKGDSAEFERAKKSILEFQKQLNKELERKEDKK